MVRTGLAHTFKTNKQMRTYILHDRLYCGPLAEFLRPEFDYEPHITLAKTVQPNQFESLSSAATIVTRETFRDLMRSVTIIREEAENEWVRERDIFLQH